MIKELQQFGDLYENASLKSLNTYRVDAKAKYLLEPNSIEDLVEILKILNENQIDYFILGNGSNIVFSDHIFDGAIIHLAKLNGMEVHKDLNIVYAEAGVLLPRIVKEAVDNSLTGLEFAAGIPGTLGGSIYGNAGAYNSCIMDYIKSVTVIDENLNIRVIEHEDLDYSYRYSNFKDCKYIIVAAKLYLKNGDKDSSLNLLSDRFERRKQSQPLEYPSAGSVFRNPEGDFAGRLIESCGLKGKIIGGAKVSEKHANFIVNESDATAKDVYDLIKYVHDVVFEKTGVDLFVEQEFVDWE